MSKQGNIKIILAFIFFGLGILFFSLAIQRYQVLTSSRADVSETINVVFESNGHGVLTQNLGIIIPIDNDALVTEIESKLKNKNIFVKIIEPTTATIQNPNFDKLAKAGFKFYFSFEDYTPIQGVLNKYKESYQNEVVVEINKQANLDAADTDTLLTTNPTIKFHAPQRDFWPTDRNNIKDILEIVSPPKLDAISIRTWVDAPQASIADDVHTMFDTFYDASRDIGNVDINYPAGTKIAVSNIETLPDGIPVQEQARRFGVITSAMASSLQADDNPSDAPVRYVIAGDVSKMSAVEKNMLIAYAEMVQAKPTIVWPKLDSVNGDVMNNIDPLIGMIGKNSDKYRGFVTNIKNQTVSVKLPDAVDWSTYASYSNLRGGGNHIEADKKITLQAFETVAFYEAPGPAALQVGTTGPDATATPTIPAGGATPFPTLPSVPSAADQLVCDSGDDPYNSNTIRITNNTDQAIEEINAVVFRCTYIPDKIRKGFYKCETCTDSDEVNNPDCQAGQFDAAASSDFSLAAGETKTISIPVNACEIVQLDVANNEVHVDDSKYECYNARSKFTNPVPPSRWQGGIAFSIQANSTGYNAATSSCTSVTNTPTVTPTVSLPLTNTPSPTDSPTPTNTPTPSNTPLPTSTPAPTDTPLPTNTLIPTNTPLPTNTPFFVNQPTPITKIAVNNQPPGSTPWGLIALPIGLILIGLLL